MGEALQAVVDYVQTPQTDYALLIGGPWGCGKTHFWKNVAEPRLRRTIIAGAHCRPLYTSLYGCESAKDIDTQLFLASHPHLRKKWTTRLASVGGSLGNKLLKALTRFELPAIDLRWLINTQNAVLCFDDLERTSLPMKEALGYINNFVEHEDVKVIILCNEENISDDDEKKTYRAMREKVVGASLAFRADLDGVFETLVGEHHKRPEFHKFLTTHRELLRRLFDRSDTQNIRALRRALSALVVIFEALKSHNIDPNKFGEQLIYVVASGSFELHGRGVEAKKLRELLGADNMAIAGWVAKSQMKDKGVDDDEHAFKAKFAERYFEGVGLANWRTPVGCPPICEYLLTGALDRTALLDWADQFIKSPDERDERIKRLAWDQRNMEDDEFSNAVQITIEEMERGDVSAIGSYFGIYQYIEWCCDAGLVAMSRQELMQKFADGLAKARERGVLAAEPRLRGTLDHPSSTQPTEEAQTLKQRVYEVNDQLLQGKRLERIKALISKFDDDPEAFIDAISGNGEDSLVLTPVFQELSATEFATQLSGTSNATKAQFLDALHVRYVRHRVGEEFKVELPVLKQLKNAVNSQVADLNVCPVKMSSLLVRQIVNALDTAVSTLQKLIPIGAESAVHPGDEIIREDVKDEAE